MLEFDSDMKSDVAEAFADIINELGKTFRLYYPSKRSPCPNCQQYPNGTSNNKYKPGGPIPFSGGICPYCNGAGQIKTENYEDIKMTVNQSPQRWLKENMNVELPQGSIMTRGFITDLPKVQSCEYALLDIGGFDNYIHQKYQLFGEPTDYFMYIPREFFIALWQRTG